MLSLAVGLDEGPRSLADLPAAAQEAISSAVQRDQAVYQAASDAGVVTLACAANIDPFLQQAKLTASASGPKLGFGTSVAISGDTIVVGAPASDSGGQTAGAAYVFTKPAGGWANMTQVAMLAAPQGVLGFGTSVAISGDAVVVGAPGGHPGDLPGGVAYVFIKPASGWMNAAEGTLLVGASSLFWGSGFGQSVAVDGDTVVVGGGATIGSNPYQGAVFLFTKPTSGWPSSMTETADLIASDGAAGDMLGCSVSISGSTVVAGAISANGAWGAAYVFTKPGSVWTGMTQTAKLTASDGAPNDNFGSSVCVSGNTVVVGAGNASVGANRSQGAAYVFRMPGSGWADMTQTAKLTASDGTGNDYFGKSVSLSGTTVVVGAQQAKLDSGILVSYGPGRAYVFTQPDSGWADMPQTARLTASDALAGDSFGRSVATSGTTIIVGADTAMVLGNAGQGAAYVFGESAGPVVTDISPKSGLIAGGTEVTIAGTGFTGATAVNFGPVALPHFTINSDTEIVAVSPAGTGVVYVTVTTPAGTSTGSSAANQFRYLMPPAYPGLYDPATALFYLRNQQSGGDADLTFAYGIAGAGWIELAGDWNGDGVDTPGMYDPTTATFYLSDRLSSGDATHVFDFGIAGQDWKPLVGDWNGDGQDGIGLYEPATSLFFFKNSFAPGDADEAVQFGVGNLGWTPIIGDWDGLPGDGFGFYEPSISAFWLKNAHTSGDAEEMFQFGMGSLGWTPLAGDWDGLPGDGVGFYVPETAQWFLKNEHTPGPADTAFVYGVGGQGWRPLVGRWGRLLGIGYRGQGTGKGLQEEDQGFKVQGLSTPAASALGPSSMPSGTADAEDETRIAAEAYIHLLNWMRHDPVGYQRGMDFGQDLSYIAPKPPLAINPSLAASAQFHASEMAQYKYFSHQSPVTGDWPNKMARDQGYALPVGWPNGANYIESACMHSAFIDPIYSWILDYDTPSLGHRHHILGYGGVSESNREVGWGSAVDDEGMVYDIIHIAQTGSSDKFLTGMVYSDANGNFRYDVGEGIAGATVVAGGRTAQTDVAGSWSLAVSSGAYTVSVSGGAFTGTSSAVVNVGNDNVEVDFISGRGQGIVNFEGVVPPTAKDDQYWVDPGEPLVVSGPGVLMNDLEEDAHRLTARLVAGPAHGTLALAADGSFTYVARDSYFSSDTFTYVANDGRYDSSVATVTLTRIRPGQLYRVSNFVPPDGMLGGVVVDNVLYFSAGNGNVVATDQSPRDPLNSSWSSQGLEVWKSDGHSMSMVTNLAYGDQVSANPYQYCAVGDAVYFTAENVLGHPEEVGAGPFELWRLQGSNLTPLGTDADCVGVLNGAVYFLNMGPEQFQLSKYENGVTTAIREFPYEPGRSISKKEYEHVVYQGQLYFHANDALWRTDGTPEGSVKVADVDPYCLTVLAGDLYFWGDIGIGENYTFGFWKYDGATLSKLSLPEDVPTPDFNDGEACSYRGALYFSGFSADWHLPGRYPDTVLWRYNGQTFEELPNEISGAISFTNPRNLCVYDGALYFSASDASGESLSLWRIQPGGMSRVTSLPESYNSIVPADDGLYLLPEAFPYWSERENYGLWKYLPPLATGPECPGLYAADSSAFFLNDQQAGGDAEHVFTYGVPGIGWVELVGDWNGDGQDTPGFYDPATATFCLTNRLEGGDADLVFQFGIAGQGWKPLVGDWNGDGQDGIGLYEPATSLFFFKNSFTAGDADEAVQFGVGSLGWQPIIGDWDGLPGDGFGFYEPAISAFWLKNAHTSGDAEEMFQFGMGSLGWTPLAGDWDGLPGDGVGFYVPQTGQWFLKNAHAPGDAEISFSYGIGGAGWRPLVGCWNRLQVIGDRVQEEGDAAKDEVGRMKDEGSSAPAATYTTPYSRLPIPSAALAVDRLDLAALAAEQVQAGGGNDELDLLFGSLRERRGRTSGKR